MAYLMIDPCGQYPAHLMPFLARLGKGAVSVFSTDTRFLLWRDKWSKLLGRHVLDTYLAPQRGGFAGLAAQIKRRWPALEGVIPWDEQSILLGAELGERLGLDWNPLRVIERCRDKAVMKAWLRERGGVRINAATVVNDAHEALVFQRELGRWPIVVKPTEGSGSENVFFPRGEGELLNDCQIVLESGAGEVLLEEYVSGKELAVNGIVDERSNLLVTDVWYYDRRSSHGVPNLYYLTHKVSSHEPIFAEVARYAADVVERLELRRAPIHMEVKVDALGPCLIEVGARLAGGNLPLLGSRLHGRSLFELAACHYLADLPLSGSDLDFEKYDRNTALLVHGVQPFEIRHIRAVHGVEQVESLPSFEGFGVLRPVGTRAPISRDLDSQAYEVYLIHPDPAQVARDAEVVRRVLRYE
ncbi:MAG: ATP-grasp domain-containing protein [Thermoanaerobaculia bacterium]|nr:ATP-grasp domain-containing protein [Thermoanaerobaculia bacterium]